MASAMVGYETDSQKKQCVMNSENSIEEAKDDVRGVELHALKYEKPIE